MKTAVERERERKMIRQRREQLATWFSGGREGGGSTARPASGNLRAARPRRPEPLRTPPK